MTYDQWKTREPNPNDEIEWELEPSELDLVYEDLAKAQALSTELLIALKDMVFYFGNPKRDEWLNEPAWRAAFEVDRKARGAIAKAERQP